METEILKLIYDYSEKEKLADKRFIIQVICILSINYHLAQYIKGIEFYDECLFKINDQIITMTYNYLTQKIIVSMEGIKIISKNKTQNFQTLLNGIEPYFHYNLLIVQLIAHEIEHVIHDRNIEQNNPTLETKLMKICTQDDNKIKELSKLYQETKEEYYQQEIKKLTQKYIQHYHYNPSERIAQIKSFQLIIKIIEVIKNKMPTLYIIETIQLLQETIKGYKFHLFYIESPTLKYLSNMNYLSELSNLDFYSIDSQKLENNVIKTIPLEERLNLGLSITLGEYKHLKKTLSITKKKIII